MVAVTKRRQTRSKAAVWTKEMRWNQLYRAAVIFGIVADDPPRTCHEVRAILRERETGGFVQSRKKGAAQSSPAYYRARKMTSDRMERKAAN
jgi:hypothetical protein